MSDYIERWAAILTVKKWADGHHYIEIKTENAVAEVNDIPPADVAPVRHGHWEEKIVEIPDLLDDPYHYFKRRFYCSSCGDWQTYGKTDYCPMCGASMESERDG